MQRKKPCFHPPQEKIRYTPEEQLARDTAKHNRVLKRIKKEFKKMPYANLTPHERLAQLALARGAMDRERDDRRKEKRAKKCKR
jgi:hypothetical protein